MAQHRREDDHKNKVHAMALTMPPPTHGHLEGVKGPRPSPADERWRVAGHVLLALGLVTLALVIVFVVLAGNSAAYQAMVTNITPVDQSTVMVTIQVVNLRSTAAVPACDIALSSSAQAYTGTASIRSPTPIAAGFAATYHVEVPVTADGATRVNLVSSMATCH
jgi:hypothetical protein